MTLVAAGYADDYFNRFRIMHEVERDGMGIHYLAQDTLKERRVLFSVLSRQLVADADCVGRFVHEVELSARLHHPNILATYDLIKSDSGGGPIYCLVREFMAGIKLANIVRLHSGPFSQPEALGYVLPVVQALADAHENGAVHRDVKPENIWVGDDGCVKIGGFGISRITDEKTITQQGDLLGSLYYIAPEQIRGEPVTPLIDIYAFGILLYQLLTGALPFVADNPGSLMQLHLTGTPVPPSQRAPHLPSAADEIILRCLAKNPHDRYASMRHVETALGEFSR